MANGPQENTDSQRAYERCEESHLKFNEMTIASSQLALRTSVLINGGAAVAILAFVGGLTSQSKITLAQLTIIAHSLIWFGSGVALATRAMVFAYFTNYFTTSYIGSLIATGSSPSLIPSPKSKIVNFLKTIFHILAVVSGLGSLLLFVYGMFEVWQSIDQIS